MARILRNVAIAALVAAAAPAGAHAQDTASEQRSRESSVPQVLGERMGKSDRAGSNTVDREFARTMRQHHLDGIEMAQSYLARGTDETLRRMARKIVDTQQKEVREFDRVLAGKRERASGGSRIFGRDRDRSLGSGSSGR